MAANQPAMAKTPKQTIEQLQARYQQLNTKKIQAATNLEHATGALQRLQDEAVAKFGTADVQALKAKLEEMKVANEEARRKYQASLDAIEGALQAIESNLSAVDARENGTAGAPQDTESGSAETSYQVNPNDSESEAR